MQFQIAATDTDALGNITYSIDDTDGPDNLFDMDTASGDLTINNTDRVLDYETKAVYSILVSANDGKPLSCLYLLDNLYTYIV